MMITWLGTPGKSLKERAGIRGILFLFAVQTCAGMSEDTRDTQAIEIKLFI